MVANRNKSGRPEELIDDRFKRAPAEGGRREVDDTLKKEEEGHSSHHKNKEEERGGDSRQNAGE